MLVLAAVGTFGYGQKPQMSLQRGNSDALSALSWGLKFSYYAPRTDNVTSVFNALEDSSGLSRGSRFDIYYLVGGNLRYSLDKRNDVGIETEVSLAQTKFANVTSIQRVYVVGAQYYYHLQPRRPGFYGVDIGGGVGWLVTNFEREYGGDNRRVAVLTNSLRLNGAVEWWAALSQNLYFELEARYLFVPNIRVENPQTTINMSSIVMSAGFSVKL